MKPMFLLPVLCLLAACHAKDAPRDKVAELAAGNTMTCTAGGITLSGKGQDIGIAGFGVKDNTLSAFALTLNAELGGKEHVVSTSLMPLPMHTGTYYFPGLDEPGMTFASYEIRTTERDLLKAYGGTTYSQHYSAVENDPEAKLKIEIDLITVSAADLPGFKRVHALGRFQFNGAALPASSPSDACVTDGIQRSIRSVGANKRLLPLFDAGVCGAEKKHVQCSFDVTTDFPVQP